VLVDLPLAELQAYRPDVAEPADFDAFWAAELAGAAGHDLAATFEPVRTPVRSAEVFDVTFAGHGGAPVQGWLLVPPAVADGAPVVVEYIGYAGGRGHPMDWLAWSAAGYPHLVMDSRGQRGADTPDPADAGEPHSHGFLTRGIGSPATYYYTRLFVDAARAVAAATAHPATAGRPVVTTGGSQGGALAIAAAHLGTGVAAALPDVPFLAHFGRAAEITDDSPYAEIAAYCAARPDRVDQAFRTLSYVDVVNHAKRATCPALFSVGLMDPITPPSTVYAVYNHYAGDRDIRVYRFNGHEGGGTHQLLAKLDFLAGLAARPGGYRAGHAAATAGSTSG
jgi:cephalosporin-C deacetylase